MPLQSSASSSDPLCLSEVRTELGISSTTRLCLGDSRVRSLAGKTSGTICLSDLLGKGSTPSNITGTGVYGGGQRLVYFGGIGYLHNGAALAAVIPLSRFTFSNDTSSLTSLRVCPLSFSTCNFSISNVGPCGSHTYSGTNDIAIFNGTLFTSVPLNLGNIVHFVESTASLGSATSKRYNLSTLTQQASTLSVLASGPNGGPLSFRTGMSGTTSYIVGGAEAAGGKTLIQPTPASRIDKVKLDTQTSNLLSSTIHKSVWGMGFGNGSESFVLGGCIDHINGFTYDGGTSLTGAIAGINHSNDTRISVSSTITRNYAGAGLGTSTIGYSCGGRQHSNPKQTNRIDQFTYSSRTRATLSNTISRALWQLGELSSTTSGYLLGGGAHSTSEPGGMAAGLFSMGYGSTPQCDWTGSSFKPPGSRGDITSDEIQKMNYSTRTVSIISTRLTTLQQWGTKGGQSVTATIGATGW